MNNIEEFTEAISIALVAAIFLLNTGRALKAIELCKEALVLLNNKALSIKQQFSKLMYQKYVGEIYETMFDAYCCIHDYKSAITYGRKLLVNYSECDETVSEGTLSLILAEIYKRQNEYVKAKELCERAITIMRETRDKEGESIACVQLGTVYQSLGDYVKAKEYFEKALVITMEIGDRAAEAKCYVHLGSVLKSLSEYVKAKKYLEKALVINMERGDRAGEATFYGNLAIATVLKSLGDNVKAKEYLEKALAIVMEIGDRAGEAACYGNLGTVFQSLGDYVKAKKYLEKALAIVMEIGDRAQEAIFYGNLGSVFISVGEHVKAIEYLEKGLVILVEIGDRAGEAVQYGNLGSVYRAKRKYGESKKFLEKALAIFMEIGDRAGEAAVYGNLGNWFGALGDDLKAKEYYEKALAIMMQIGYRAGEAAVYRDLGVVCQSLKKYITSEEYLEKALSISKDIRDGEIEFQCYCFLSWTKLSQGESKEALSNLFRGIEKCEDLRGFNADSDEIKISFADMHVFPYENFSGLLCDAGNINNALYVVELGRARSLADLMATQYSAEKPISANPQSWICIENIMMKESNCTCLYISYHAQEVFLWILKTSGVISFRKITVDKKTLYKRLPKLAENLDEFFAIMAKRFRSFGIVPEEVCEDRSLNDIESDSSQEERLPDLRHAKDEDDPKLSLALFQEMLINPVSDLLEDPEIIIVPDRNLYRVPFAALIDGSGKYLSETFRIRIVPSLTTLKLIQDSPADYHSQAGALIVGDPDVGVVIYNGRLNKNFVPLPGARKEAEMIGRLLSVQPLLGQHATKQAVLQRIDAVSLIHFAAHGNAERGEIALTPPSSTTAIPQEDDYLLKMSDISKVQLRAKLVVLSCCHSGRGQIRAEGVVGIARAFLGSGARSVLVALWALKDSATKQFMSRFYEHLVRGESASESLHEAMKWMRGNGFPEVSDWAPFMLIGDNVTFDFRK